MTAAATKPKDGTERAAILMLALGEKGAADVLKHLSPRDVQKVGTAMAGMSGVSRELVATVLNDFSTATDQQTSFGVGTDEYLRKVLSSALGETRAAGIVERIMGGRSSRGLEAVKWMDPRSVAEMMRSEHPQIVAIVLAYLDADHAAAVLANLPDNQRADIVMRIASLDTIQPSALAELDGALEKMLAGNANATTSVFGGPKVAANIINQLDTSIETVIMEHIAKADEALAAKLQDMTFTFANLIDVDERGMQELMREVPADKLAIALKAADEVLKEKFFKAMSQRAAAMLKDDLESKGPVRLSEVEAAQKEILSAARKLAEAGTISLGKQGGSDAFV